MNNKKTYVKDDSVQLFEILLVFNIVRGDIFGEIGLTKLGDGLVKGQPIEFFDKANDVVLVEVALSVDGFLDLDEQGVVVLVAFCHVAD